MKTLLETKHLSLGYEGKAIIKDLTFAVEAHDFITVLGANGSGKSTLVKGLLKLIRPMNGEVIYHLERNMIGYMPQATKVDAHFPATVMEIVELGTLNRLGHRPFFKKTEKKLAAESLDLLGISQLAKESFSSLSGGQKQKVLLARALSATRELLVLDEPSNNLDMDSKREFNELIMRLNKDKGIAIILITHDVNYHALPGNKVLSFEENGIFFGAKEDYMQ